MFLVICYAVHERDVASVEACDTYEEACERLRVDAENTYEEELNSGSVDAKLKLFDETARLSSCDEDYLWTWNVVCVQK